MSGPSQALVLRFRTDLGEAQKNITNFAAQAVVNLDKLGQRAVETKRLLDRFGATDTLDLLLKNADAISKIGTGLKIGAGVFVGYEALRISLEGITAAGQAAEDRIGKLIAIGAGAAHAGVGTSFFQAWTGQAKALNLETSDLVAMLEKAREAATETIGENGGTSTSKVADRIKQNVLGGYLPQSALTSYNNADTEEQRIRVMLDLVEQLKQKGAQLAAFDLGKTFFGPTFEAQLRNGVDIIGQLRVEKEKLQAVGGERIIPPEEIENARKMKAELDDINTRLAAASEPFLKDIARFQQNILQSTIEWKGEWTKVLELFGAAWPVIKNIADAIGAAVAGAASLGFSAEEAITRVPRPEGQAYGPDAPVEIPAVTARKDDPSKRGLPSLNPSAARASSGGAGAEKTDQVETFIRRLQKETAAEEAEAQTLGLGNKAKREAVDLAKAREAASERGSALTQAETDKIKGLADAYVAAKGRIDAYARAQENAKAQAEFFGSTLESAIEQAIEPGAKLQDVLQGVVSMLEKAALKALILGEGPLASLFGTAAPAGATGASAVGGLFGLLGGGASGGSGGGPGGLLSLFSGMHANGGAIPSGHWGIAGEAGPEIINGPATITPWKHIDAALNAGRSPSPMAFTHAPTYHIMPAQGVTPAQLADVLKRHDDDINRTLGTRLRKWEGRFG